MGITVIPGVAMLIVVDSCITVDTCEVGTACAICAEDPAEATTEEDSVCTDATTCGCSDGT